HVAAEGFGNDRAARFAARGSDTDAAEKRMEWDFHFVAGVKGLEGRGLACVIDRVEPYFFRERRMQHRRVVGGVERAEAGAEGTQALIAVDLQIEKFHDERVAGFRAVDEEGTGQRIVAFDEGKRVAGLLDGIAEAIERVSLENIAGMKMSDGRS